MPGPISVTQPLSLGQLQILNAVMHLLASTPGSPVEGQYWWDTSSKRMRLWDGTEAINVATMDDIAGAGGGDMTKAVYDPQNINGDAFARANMTGTQLADTISNLAAAVALLDADTVDGLHSADLLARGNHTGTQPASTISDFVTAVNAQVDAYLDVEAANAAYDTISEIAVEIQNLLDSDASIATQIADKTDKFAVDVGNGSLTNIPVVHNLNTLDVVVQVYRNSDDQQVIPDVAITDVNTVTLGFASAPTVNAYRCVVVG